MVGAIKRGGGGVGKFASARRKRKGNGIAPRLGIIAFLTFLLLLAR